MGWEAHPNEYEQRHDEDGKCYVRKPEYRAEQEAVISREAEEERANRERVESEKRATRRVEPMTKAEAHQALAKARLIAEWLQKQAEVDQREREEAEILSWQIPPTTPV